MKLRIIADIDTDKFPEYDLNHIGQENMRVLMDTLLVEGMMKTIVNHELDKRDIIAEYEHDGLNGERIHQVLKVQYARDLEIAKRIMANLKVEIVE